MRKCKISITKNNFWQLWLTLKSTRSFFLDISSSGKWRGRVSWIRGRRPQLPLSWRHFLAVCSHFIRARRQEIPYFFIHISISSFNELVCLCCTFFHNRHNSYENATLEVFWNINSQIITTAMFWHSKVQYYTF